MTHSVPDVGPAMQTTRLPFWKKHLVARLVLAFSLLTLLAINLISYAAYTQAQRAMIDSVYEELGLIADLRISAFTRWLQDWRSNVELLAQLPEINALVAQLATIPPQSSEYERIQSDLRRQLLMIQSYKPDIENLMILQHPGGQILASTNPQQEGDYRTVDAFFTQGRQQTYLQSIYTSPLTGRPALTISTPLRPAANQPVTGVLAVHLNLRIIDQLLGGNIHQHKSQRAYLVDQVNELIAGQAPETNNSPRGVHSQGIQLALSGQDGQGLYNNSNGTPVVGVYRWLPDQKMALLSEVDQVEAYAPARRLGLLIFMAGILLTGLTGGIAYLLAEQIARPILAITRTAVQVAAGSLQLEAPVTTQDEVGILAQTFNHMTTRLRQTLSSLEQTIHELQTTSQALRASEDRFRRLAEHAPDSIYRYRIQPKFQLEYVSPAIESITGISVTEYYRSPTTLLRIIHPDDRPQAEKILRGEIDPTEPITIRLLQNGQTIYIELLNVLVPGETTGELFIEGIARNATQRVLTEQEIRRLNEELEERVRQRTEQLEAANRELEAFAYSVSHDLRAPLRAIDGFSVALLEDYHDKLDEQGQTYLNWLRQASQRMSELINDMLHLSRITRSELRRAPVNLSLLAEEVAAELHRQSPERQLECRVQPDLTAQADPRLARILLENLLGNAWKFTSRRAQARVEVSGSVQEGQMVFCVRDNGAGFDMRFSDKLFKPFQRLHDQSEFEGTGIGLATVQRIIHRHNGRIWAEGAVEQGAAVYFTFGD